MCVISKQLDPLQTSSLDLFCSLSTGMLVGSPPLPTLPSGAWLWTTRLKFGVGFEQVTPPPSAGRAPFTFPLLGLGLANSQLLDSRDGVRAALPFLGRRKLLGFVVAGKMTSGQKNPKSIPRCVAFYFKTSPFDLGANQTPDLSERAGLAGAPSSLRPGLTSCSVCVEPRN